MSRHTNLRMDNDVDVDISNLCRCIRNIMIYDSNCDFVMAAVATATTSDLPLLVFI